MAGIEKIPLRIPPQWESTLPGFTAWFTAFVRESLSRADVRNASGVGVTVAGDPSTAATLTVNGLDFTTAPFALITADPSYPAGRTLFGETGVVKVTDQGAGLNAVISIESSGITFSKIQKITALSVMGNATDAEASVNLATAGSNDTFLRRVSNALSFGQLTNGMVPDNTIAWAKLVSANADVLAGASTAGALTEITCTAAGRALLDDATAGDQRTTLGLGTAATSASTAFAAAVHTHVAADITDVQIKTGTGTPEGAVTATVGAIFLRTDGGAATTLYVKESGTGNTGWVAK